MRALSIVSLSGVLMALWLGTAHADADDWFARDKALHFGVSASLATLGTSVALLLDGSAQAHLALGLGAPLLLGVGKEVFDALHHGDPSWRDLSWDVLGTLVGFSVTWLIAELVFPRGSAQAERAQLQPRTLQIRRSAIAAGTVCRERARLQRSASRQRSTLSTTLALGL